MSQQELKQLYDKYKGVKRNDLVKELSAQNSRTLEQAVAENICNILDPDSGNSRLVDGVTDQTALYTSKVEFPIYADASVSGGRFTIVAQPTLGAPIVPRTYKLGIWDNTSGDTNFSSNAAFINTSNGMPVKYDPNLNTLLAPTLVQNSWSLAYDVDIVNLSNQSPYVDGQAGTNNTGFVHYPAGVYSPDLGFTPTFGLFAIPNGTYYSNMLSNFVSYTSDYGKWMEATNYNANYLNINAVVTRFALCAWEVDLISPVAPNYANTAADSMRISLTASTTGIGSPSLAIRTGKYFKYAKGMMGAPTGMGASITNAISALFAASNYITQPPTPTKRVLYSVVYEDLGAANLVGKLLQLNWDLTSTVLDATPVSSNPLVERIRPSGMKVHFCCTLPEINRGGNIATALLPGDRQSIVFSPQGYEFTSFQSLCSQNLVKRFYQGNLAQGSYTYYSPEMLLDLQMRSYSASLEYNYPFIVVSGNYTPPSGSTGQTLIGYLRVITNFEYSTTSTVVATDSQIGSDAIMGGILSALAQYNRAMENPTHKKTLQNIVRGAGSVVSTLTNIMPHVSKVLNGVGALLL